MIMFDDERYPPLISPRSPSYERGWREFLHPTATDPPQVIALLGRLSEAEHNASQICLTAASVLSDPRAQSRVRDDALMHQERRHALENLIEALGGSAPTISECREILASGLDAVALARSDGAARQALHTMRRRLSDEYEDAMRSPEINESQRAALRDLAPVPTAATVDGI